MLEVCSGYTLFSKERRLVMALQHMMMRTMIFHVSSQWRFFVSLQSQNTKSVHQVWPEVAY